MRLDQYVATHLGLSRSQAAKAIREGHVRCNGHRVTKASRRISEGDTVTLEEGAENIFLKPKTSNLKPPLVPLLYEDDACIVVNKPQNIAVAPLLDLLKKQQNLPSLLLAHRLDKGTSGCLLLAKSAKSCEALQKQFQERTVHKKYLAVIAGIPAESEATIDAPVGRNLTNRKKMSLFRTSKSRSAVTHYRILSKGTEAALLECVIHTGRTHQIRVHMRAIGHPILGDTAYGNAESESLSEKHDIASPCLHARMLSFHSPETKEQLVVRAPIPESFQEVTRKLDLALPIP